MKSFGKIIDLLIVIAAIEFIPQLSSYVANHLVGYFEFLDPDHAFAWNYLHHSHTIGIGIIGDESILQQGPLGVGVQSQP